MPWATLTTPRPSAPGPSANSRVGLRPDGPDGHRRNDINKNLVVARAARAADRHRGAAGRIQSVIQEPTNHHCPTALIGPLRDLLRPDVGAIGGTWLPALANCVGISDKAERIFQFRDEDVPRICQEHEDAGMVIGEALFLTLFKLATDATLRPDSTAAAAFAVSQLIGGNTVNKFLRSGLASELLDTHDYTLDGAQVGNSAEYFFDAAKNAHLNFIDGVIALANTHAPVFGYIGIRFMPRSAALLGMPRFATSASVEVSTARSRMEDVYAGFWNDVHALANASGGVALFNYSTTWIS
jgi:hypothetical protein